MKVPATLRVNNLDINTTISVKLSGNFEHIPFTLTSPIVLQTNVDLTKPIQGIQSVYIIKGDRDNYKIGYGNPLDRLKTFQTGNPYKLRLIACCPGGKELETSFHDMFKNKRIYGEWFDLKQKDIEEITKIMAINYFKCLCPEDMNYWNKQNITPNREIQICEKELNANYNRKESIHHIQVNNNKIELTTRKPAVAIVNNKINHETLYLSNITGNISSYETQQLSQTYTYGQNQPIVPVLKLNNPPTINPLNIGIFSNNTLIPIKKEIHSRYEILGNNYLIETHNNMCMNIIGKKNDDKIDIISIDEIDLIEKSGFIISTHMINKDEVDKRYFSSQDTYLDNLMKRRIYIELIDYSRVSSRRTGSKNNYYSVNELSEFSSWFHHVNKRDRNKEGYVNNILNAKILSDIHDSLSLYNMIDNANNFDISKLSLKYTVIHDLIKDFLINNGLPVNYSGDNIKFILKYVELLRSIQINEIPKISLLYNDIDQNMFFYHIEEIYGNSYINRNSAYSLQELREISKYLGINTQNKSRAELIYDIKLLGFLLRIPSYY